MRQSMIETLQPRLEAGLKKAMSRGAAGAKLGFYHVENMNCDFEAGRLKSAEARETLIVNVDVLLNGRIGHTDGNRVEALDQLIDDAFVLARVGKTAHFDTYPKPGSIVPVTNHSARTTGLTREQLVGGCERIVGALKAYNPDLFIRAGGVRHESEGLLVTSGGVCRPNRTTIWVLHGGAQRTEGTDILFTGEHRYWGDLNEFFDPQEIIDRNLLQLRNAERIVPAPDGRTTIVVPPDTLGMFLYCIWMGIHGRNVAKGDSPLRDKLGQQVLAPCFSIVDDPHQPFSGGEEIDCDGIPTRKQALFEKGVLQRFLYDLDSAGLAGAQPTGNRDCAPYAAYIPPGRRPLAELIRSVNDGILLHNLIGFGQGNLINGDFSGNIGLGYRIQKGEITGRVKDTMLAGNLYELLKNEVELSSDLNYRGTLPWAVIGGAKASTKK